MKLSTLITRLCEQTSTLQLRDAISRQRTLPDRCMIWQGAHTKMGLQLVPQKDKYGVRYLTQTLLRPYAKIRYEGKVQMAHQLIYQLVYPDRPRTRLRQMCSSMLCVNPNHWVPFETYNAVPDDAEPPVEGDWTIEEVRALIDTFLANYPGRLIDPDHNLLMDIPPTLLAEVLSRDEYYSGRVLQRDGDRG